MIYRAFMDYRHSTDTPVRLKAGDRVECLEESDPAGDWPNWVLCRAGGIESWVPVQILERSRNEGTVTEDYSAAEHDLTPGEIFRGTIHLNGWFWCHKDADSEAGAWAPLNCLVPEYSVEEVDSGRRGSLVTLSEEAASDGFSFVQRLTAELETGENDFSKTGEVLLGCFSGNECIAVCGLNIDPYADDPAVGRLRRLYVSGRVRRKGVGRSLVGVLIEKAGRSFGSLRLYTENPSAAAFYEAIGFRPSNKLKESHIMAL